MEKLAFWASSVVGVEVENVLTADCKLLVKMLEEEKDGEYQAFLIGKFLYVRG